MLCAQLIKLVFFGVLRQCMLCAQLIKASVPLSEMFQYVSTLRGMTKGRAQYSMALEKYDTVPNTIQQKIVGEHAAKLQEA